MAQRFNDPFAEPAPHLKSDSNPYLHVLRGASDADLPIKFGAGLKGIAGAWREKFAMPQAPDELILEIGCHLGKNLCEFATDYPDKAFIGADITFKRVCKSAMRAKERQLTNIQAILFNAKHLRAVFAPQELSGTVIFFPDPWVKERRAKHRLIGPEFAEALFSVTGVGGFLWFKTDQEPYFNDACAAFSDAGFVACERTAMTKQDYLSTFERKFKLAGLETFERFFLKANSDGLQSLKGTYDFSLDIDELRADLDPS